MYKDFCEKCVLIKRTRLGEKRAPTGLVGKQLVLPLVDFVLCSASLLFFKKVYFLMIPVWFSTCLFFHSVCLCLWYM